QLLEECDQGDAKNTDTPAYNAMACTKACKNIHLRCGDNKKNGPEACDGEDVEANRKCKADCSGLEPIPTPGVLRVIGYSGLVCPASLGMQKCLEELNAAEGAGLDPACGGSVSNELVFAKVPGKVEGRLKLTLTGTNTNVFGTEVTCGDPKVTIPSTGEIPASCYDKNQDIKVQLKFQDNTCGKVTYAVINGSFLPR
ncbi:MAG TPA: hypothetical protein VGG33_22060, partial [Polyangia bacterium]